MTEPETQFAKKRKRQWNGGDEMVTGLLAYRYG
jgi:hypothetical protein